MATAAVDVQTPSTEQTIEQPEKMDGTDAKPVEGTSGGQAEEATSEPLEKKPKEDAPDIKFKVTFNGKLHDLCFAADTPIRVVKEHLEKATQIPCNMQKLLWKAKKITDDSPLADAGLKDGQKVMMVGCKVDDVFKVQAAETEMASQPSSEQASTTNMHLFFVDDERTRNLSSGPCVRWCVQQLRRRQPKTVRRTRPHKRRSVSCLCMSADLLRRRCKASTVLLATITSF